MKYLIQNSFMILILFMSNSCSEKKKQVTNSCDEGSQKARVEKWYEYSHSLAEYRKLQPDRPILVFYNTDWSLHGAVAMKQMREERFFDLFTEHRVLPLLADFTDTDGDVYKELKRIRPDEVGVFCLALARPGKEIAWFRVNGVSSDELYKFLKTKLNE